MQDSVPVAESSRPEVTSPYQEPAPGVEEQSKPVVSEPPSVPTPTTHSMVIEPLSQPQYNDAGSFIKACPAIYKDISLSGVMFEPITLELKTSELLVYRCYYENTVTNYYHESYISPSDWIKIDGTPQFLCQIDKAKPDKCIFKWVTPATK